MKHQTSIILLTIALLLPSSLRSDEGMWLLDAIKKLPLAEMQRHGLVLTPEQIYNANGSSLKDAIVLLGGGTASFISREGLIITNHHVAFSAIQELSSVQEDYLEKGFLARTRAEELSTPYTAQVVESMTDVTEKVLTGTDTIPPFADRFRTIHARIKEVEDSVADKPGRTSRVVAMYEGLKYYLFTYLRLLDVRLVYAPPSSIGNFGGEVDNWEWPRHTGDFSIMRVYVGPDSVPAKYSKENIPFAPKKFLPISTHGCPDSSFAMILGFPGRTYRYRDAAEIAVATDVTLPLTCNLYKTRIDVITAAMEKDRSTAIKYASAVRRIQNAYKKYLGMIEGMKRSDVLASRTSEERELSAYISSHSGLNGKYASLLPSLKNECADLGTIERKDLLFGNIVAGVNLIRVANRFASLAGGHFTDSLGKTIDPPEPQRKSAEDFAASVLKDTDPGVDKEILAALLNDAVKIAGADRPVFVSDIVGTRTGTDAKHRIEDFVNDLYDGTSLATIEGCKELIEKSPRKILKDDLVDFAAKIAGEREPTQLKAQTINKSLDTLREQYVAVWMAWKHPHPTYPDANRTLRLTYGKVVSLSPRDAVHYSFETSLAGVIEKESDESPFIVPEKLKSLWQAGDFGRYKDQALNDIPVNFLTDDDITGGNSGSPVINGKGELIGCAFDGNWDGIVGDYLFQEKYDRTISVDARYVLFILDKYAGAKNLLNEMEIR